MGAARDSDDVLGEGQLVAGRFRLIRPLSSGGMGSVWVAHHTGLGIEVAVKFVDAEGDARAEALRRFEREANLVARLRSPNVVQILDYGTAENGRPFIVMELLQGVSLRDHLRRVQRLSLPALAKVVIPICNALHRAHRAGVIHRDIKPANIFLCDEDDTTIVKVLDFGIAKARGEISSDDQNTATGAIVGTPAYMSPEQTLNRSEIDGRSDLFSLGILAWRCLIGCHPHETDGKSLGLTELLIAITTKPAPAPSSLLPSLTSDIDAWFARALALDPAERFPNAKEMAESLARLSGLAEAGLDGWGTHSGARNSLSGSGAPGSSLTQSNVRARWSSGDEGTGAGGSSPGARALSMSQASPELTATGWTASRRRMVLAVGALLALLLAVGGGVAVRASPAVAPAAQAPPPLVAIPAVTVREDAPRQPEPKPITGGAPPTEPARAAPSAPMAKPPASPKRPPAAPVGTTRVAPGAPSDYLLDDRL